MRTVIHKGRPVDITSVNSMSSDPVDAFVETAYWFDTGKELTDEEMEDFAMSGDADEIIQELWLDYCICRAEDAAERENEEFY